MRGGGQGGWGENISQNFALVANHALKKTTALGFVEGRGDFWEGSVLFVIKLNLQGEIFEEKKQSRLI